MHNFDCIIIGAGPAGANTAFYLSKRGKEVILLDKASFPRYKPCAGGLTMKSAKVLDIDYKEKVQYTSRNAKCSYNQKTYVNTSSDKPVCYMVDRTEFDEFFVSKTIDAGAHFSQETEVKDINFNADKKIFTVRTSKGDFSAPFLVGADGANSIVNKKIKIVDDNFKGFGVEINYPLDEEAVKMYNQTMEFNIVPFGYLWIFPKKKHLCIGAYTVDYKNVNIKEYLELYLSRLGFDNYDPSDIKGHTIPYYGIFYKQPDFPCILVGDAAGFSDYWTGEGIFYALKSGQITADIIIKSIDDKKFYYKELQKRYNCEIIRGLKTAYKLGHLFYKHMPVSFKILFSRIILRIFFYSTIEGITFDKTLLLGPFLFVKSFFVKIKINRSSSLAKYKVYD